MISLYVQSNKYFGEQETIRNSRKAFQFFESSGHGVLRNRIEEIAPSSRTNASM